MSWTGSERDPWRPESDLTRGDALGRYFLETSSGATKRRSEPALQSDLLVETLLTTFHVADGLEVPVMDYYGHKVGVLERHCENAGCDPGEIKRTILMPVMVTDDETAAAAFIAGRKLGEGAVAGPKNYVIDRIGEFVEAGVDEIMFAGLPTPDVEPYQRIEQDALSLFN